MARAFVRLSLIRQPLFRVLGALLVLGTLSACVAPRHGGYYGGGYHGRGYAQYQPVYRGGWQGGHHHRGHHHHRHWR